VEQTEAVPDLYELAFMPGQFRCPQCDFRWSIQTLCAKTGHIGTTEENRQTPDCPNDGTRMLNVTYREQLESYALRLHEEFDTRDALVAALRGLMNLTDQGREGGMILSRYDHKPITNGDQDVIDRAYIAADAALSRVPGGKVERTLSGK
jgi:hypothetical protein